MVMQRGEVIVEGEERRSKAGKGNFLATSIKK
jgi:hypothetical protein